MTITCGFGLGACMLMPGARVAVTADPSGRRPFMERQR